MEFLTNLINQRVCVSVWHTGVLSVSSTWAGSRWAGPYQSLRVTCVRQPVQKKEEAENVDDDSWTRPSCCAERLDDWRFDRPSSSFSKKENDRSSHTKHKNKKKVETVRRLELVLKTNDFGFNWQVPPGGLDLCELLICMLHWKSKWMESGWIILTSVERMLIDVTVTWLVWMAADLLFVSGRKWTSSIPQIFRFMADTFFLISSSYNSLEVKFPRQWEIIWS